MQCEECGGIVVRRDYEYVCESCGLVHDVDAISCFSDFERSFPELSEAPVKLGTRGRMFYSLEEKRFARILDHVKTYASGMPRHVVSRAIYLARKYAGRIKKGGNLEAYAIACVERAAREYRLGSVLPRVQNFFTRRRARLYLRTILGNPLPDVRGKVLFELVKLCTRFGVRYEDCLEMYSRHEKLLSGRTPRVAAAAIVYMVNPELTLHEVCDAAGACPSAVRGSSGS